MIREILEAALRRLPAPRGGKSNKDNIRSYTVNDQGSVSSGRESVPEGGGAFSALDGIQTIYPDFDPKFIDAIKLLAIYNSDVSFAVDNIVQLGNTGHLVKIEGPTDNTVAVAMAKTIRTDLNESYRGGMTSLVNDLFAMLATSGVISAEMVVSPSLDDVMRVILVDAATILFQYDEKEATYKPFQKSGLMNKPVALNEVTYKYYPFRRYSEKPYGIPPFLAALENVVLERGMLENFKYVVKKLGLFGFLEVLIKKPGRKVEGKMETDSEYEARLKTYIEEQAKEVEKGMSKGFIVGVEDSHKFNMQGKLQNAVDVSKLFQLVSEMKMAGLKQDPSMLGRNFSTTETLGRVLLVKLTTQIKNYQKLVSRFLEDLYRMQADLQGLEYESITVTFNEIMLGDQLRESQSMNLKVDYQEKLYQQGVISQVQRANSLGYDDPYLEEPLTATEESPENHGERKRKKGERVNDPNEEEDDATNIDSKE